MNGAQALLRTLVASGVDTCFMNPGTSEMHFVAGLDSVPEMRGVLALFEGVATGAADGYGRMTGRPAATLLHLGPGLGNGLANLHNARRAATPLVNIVGDHATDHKKYDAPLESDIETVARNVSSWVCRSSGSESVGPDTAEAVAAALGPPGGVATLILPADASWSEGAAMAGPVAPRPAPDPEESGVQSAAAALRSGQPAALLIGGDACRRDGLRLLAGIAAATGARVLCETFPARIERGAGTPEVSRLAYLAEFAAMQLDGLRHLVLVGARSPVSFFAYPGKPSDLLPEGCQAHVLAQPGMPALPALQALASELGVRANRGAAAAAGAPVTGRPELPSGPLTVEACSAALGALLPEGAIVSDESATSGLHAPSCTAGAPPHDWLTLTGGAIGQGLPVALGAAVACPERKVIALEADGSSLYTMQAWWTMARHALDVVTLLYNNRSYAILNLELQRVGAAGGTKAREMLDLSHPDMDFVSLARGLGVPAVRATTADELVAGLREAIATPGPSVVEAVVPPVV